MALTGPTTTAGSGTLSGAQIGTIRDSKFYEIHGSATFNQNSVNILCTRQTTIPSSRSRALELIRDTKAMLEKFFIARFRQIHAELVDQRTPETGESFKATDEVQTWFMVPGSFLWVRGGPGAGKTYLACALVEWADKVALSSDTPMAVVCIYLRYTEQLTAWEICLGIIIQLVQQSRDLPSIPHMVDKLFERHEMLDQRPSLSDLAELLRDIINEYPKACIYLDGLDEMKTEVQAAITGILASVNAHVLFTSRPLVFLENRVRRLKQDQAVFVDVAAQDEDLDLFIADMIEKTPGLGKLLDRHGIRKEVVEKIKRNAGGMFLHAALQIETLQECLDLRSILKKLDTFPPKIEDLYAITVKRIKRLPDAHAALALRVLVWLVHVRGSISMEELQCALSVCPETYKFEPDRVVMEDHLLSICCGLVYIEHLTRQARLIHYTAHRTLAAILCDYIPTAHDMISRTCIAQLVACGFQASTLLTVQDLRTAFSSNPLLEYAHRNIAYHAYEGSKSLSSSDLRSCVQEFVQTCESFPYSPPFNTHPEHPLHLLTPLHVATLFNHPRLVQDLVADRGWGVNDHAKCATNTGWTSLMIAAAEGALEALEALLSLPGSNPNLPDYRGFTPLLVASALGHHAVTQRLLKAPGVDVNWRDEDGRSALMRASANGHNDIVQTLLKVNGVDPNSEDKDGWTPLIGASWYGHERVVQTLLAISTAKINHQNHGGWSPLMSASWNGRDASVRVLLASPALDVNAQDVIDGWPAVFHAAYRGHTTTLNLLLAHPATRIDLRSKRGETIILFVLSYHWKKYHHETVHWDSHDPEKVALLLLDRDDVVSAGLAGAPDQDGWTPLMAAAKLGYVEVAKKLVSMREVDVKAVNKDGSDALELASASGCAEIVEAISNISNINLVG